MKEYDPAKLQQMSGSAKTKVHAELVAAVADILTAEWKASTQDAASVFVNNRKAVFRRALGHVAINNSKHASVGDKRPIADHDIATARTARAAGTLSDNGPLKAKLDALERVREPPCF